MVAIEAGRVAHAFEQDLIVCLVELRVEKVQTVAIVEASHIRTGPNVFLTREADVIDVAQTSVLCDISRRIPALDAQAIAGAIGHA